MKIDDVLRNTLDYFEGLDDSVLQEIATNTWAKKFGITDTNDLEEFFVKQSKDMITFVKENTEINSKDMLKIVAVALFEYAKKLRNDISQCDSLEIDKIRKLRGEMLNAEDKAKDILDSLSQTENK